MKWGDTNLSVRAGLLTSQTIELLTSHSYNHPRKESSRCQASEQRGKLFFLTFQERNSLRVRQPISYWTHQLTVRPAVLFSFSQIWYIIICRWEVQSLWRQLQPHRELRQEADSALIPWEARSQSRSRSLVWGCWPVQSHHQPRPGGRTVCLGLQGPPRQAPADSLCCPPDWRRPWPRPLLDEALVALSDPSQVSAGGGHLGPDHGEE